MSYKPSPFNRTTLPYLVGVLMVGLLVGWVLKPSPSTQNLLGGPIRQGNQGLINPLLGYELSNSKEIFSDLKELRADLAEKVDQLKEQGKVERVSIYFRDFQTGHWTGINEDEKYFPASLFKVPIMIASLLLSEKEPELLDRKIRYVETPNDDERKYSQAFMLLKPGQEYTVRELMRAMIVDSDNGALNLLVDLLANPSYSKYLVDLFSELGINFPEDTPGPAAAYGLSARNYSLFFRVLYNATILGRTNSQSALELLTQTTFNEGLVEGIPKGVKVAHKFGERVSSNPQDLHDCGIVYDPKNPYLICIMTSGKDVSLLPAVISDLSKMVYESDSRKK